MFPGLERWHDYFDLGLPRKMMMGEAVSELVPQQYEPAPTRTRDSDAESLVAFPGGDDGNRTHVEGFAGPCLSHSATSPH